MSEQLLFANLFSFLSGVRECMILQDNFLQSSKMYALAMIGSTLLENLDNFIIFVCLQGYVFEHQSFLHIDE